MGSSLKLPLQLLLVFIIAVEKDSVILTPWRAFFPSSLNVQGHCVLDVIRLSGSLFHVPGGVLNGREMWRWVPFSLGSFCRMHWRQVIIYCFLSVLLSLPLLEC